MNFLAIIRVMIGLMIVMFNVDFTVSLYCFSLSAQNYNSIDRLVTNENKNEKNEKL